MPNVFEVQSDDISKLDAVQLSRLLDKLLRLEARSCGIAEKAIDVALNINVPDGGEDGRIEWRDGPDNTSFLPCRLIQFQNKATSMGPTDCAREILDRDGKVKRKIDQVLDAHGAYILFTTQPCTNSMKESRVAAIRAKLEELERPYAETAEIQVYDANFIQGWVNRFLPAIVAVLNWTGRPHVTGLQRWDDWEQHPENHLFGFVPDHARIDAIADLREVLSQPKNCARIIGLSGLGKTRLALEVCRGAHEDENFNVAVVYIDARFAKQNVLGLVICWVQQELEGLIVVDNCELSLHKQIRHVIERPNSKISFLSMDYDPEQDDTRTIRLGPMDDDSIKRMLQPVYEKRIPDLDRVASFAQGFPQMAVLLAKARLERSTEMGSLTDDDLLKKMLWGAGDGDPIAERILRACSLFEKFGVDAEVDEELSFITTNVVAEEGVDEDRVYDSIRAFEDRGIVNLDYA